MFKKVSGIYFENYAKRSSCLKKTFSFFIFSFFFSKLYRTSWYYRVFYLSNWCTTSLL